MEQQQLQSKREKLSCMSHLEQGQESKDREREIRGVEYYMILKIIFCTLPDFILFDVIPVFKKGKTRFKDI